MTCTAWRPAATSTPARARQAAKGHEQRVALPRLGFLGVGWIGAARMRAVVESGAAEVAAVADVDPRPLDAARAHAPGAEVARSLPQLLEMDLDGVVIATPSGLHAEQAIACLSRGIAVYCQKPLGASAPEARRAIQCARENDRLLGVDLCYRDLHAFKQVREVIGRGEIGAVHGADLVFHNAYGPDKSWARDRALAGGGCVIDLGTHLVDLMMVALGWPSITRVESHLMSQGRRLCCNPAGIEDYASALLWTDGDQSVRLACSWNFHAGQGAVISAAFYGERGSVGVRNVEGSFFDFEATCCRGADRQGLCGPPDDWQGRGIVAWARRLAEDPGFDPEIRRVAEVAAVIDRIYQR